MSEHIISDLLKVLGNPGECRGCKDAVWWCLSRQGRATPVNSDGSLHFKNCESVKEFNRERARTRPSDYRSRGKAL